MFKNIRLDAFKGNELYGYVNTELGKISCQYKNSYTIFNILKFYDSYVIYNEHGNLCKSDNCIIFNCLNGRSIYDNIFNEINNGNYHRITFFIDKNMRISANIGGEYVNTKPYSMDLNRYLTSDDFENVENFDLELLGTVDDKYKLINKLKIQQNEKINEKINEQSIKLNNINHKIININDLIINHKIDISELKENYNTINDYISRNSNIMINNLNRLNQNNK